MKRAFCCLALLSCQCVGASEVSLKTFTYKPNLQADIYHFAGASNQPVVIFIHGGALMMGGRGMSTNSGSLLHALVTAGYVVASIDYPLAPHVKLPAIIEDVQDACKWVREKGPALFGINPDEIFVMGQSAGGYLTLMAGFKVEPRPRALVSFWGYGDIAGAWYSQPDPFYLKQPLVSKEEADEAGGGRLYLYCRQQGLWPKVLTGRDPHTNPAAFDPFCPVHNVSKDYPPTLLIHGDKDTDVPYEQSVLIAKELSRHGVPHELITITNGGHGISRRDTALAARIHAQVVQFLNQHRHLQNSFLGNKSLEGDQRGRIPFWGEELNDTLLPGKRAGQLRLDSEVKREGPTSVQLTPTADWMALSSVNYQLPGWTDTFELSGWARGDQGSMPQILACWTDDQQKVLRVDASPILPLRGEDWQRISLVPPSPPSNAMAMRLVAAARGGKVWFDDFELLRLPPREKRLRIFANQIGYELAGPKSAVVAANFLPHNEMVSFKLLTPKNKVAWKQDVASPSRVHSGKPDDWGWYFWRVDFSSLKKADRYHAVAELASVRGESFPFHVKSGVLLEQTAQSAVDFFFIQRCGFDVPGWHKACHLDDARLPDGTHMDAIGGWHSAGDYNKLMYEHGDGGVVFALLTAYRTAPKQFRRFDRNRDGSPDALEEADWGARFVAKMQILETGAMRNHVNQGLGRQWTKWAAPELHTDNVIGTDDDPVMTPGEGNSPLIIGGWARLSVLLKQRDYLERALRLWNYATKGGTQLGGPHLIISTLELYDVTREPAHWNYARRSVQKLLADDIGDLSAAALAHFALTHPQDALSPKIKESLLKYVTSCAANNPFGISGQTKTNFFPADLGNNFQFLSRSWAASLIYQLTGDERALRFAADHLDWVLGKNPLNLCMFEGKGSFNPPRYHHRYNAIPGRERGAVPGTIPNGFVRDMGLADRPGFDLSRGGNRSPSFRTSEPWLVHNLYYLLAASALDRAVAR